ncbi:hypothetical protein H0H93_009236 [Arthromyces matolae]|nr:hypothetical protein H0H93_009236 [Arthromyces matolae]
MQLAIVALLSATLFTAVKPIGAIAVNGERHTVHFYNKCGFGTPILIQGGKILSTGEDYVSYGPLSGAIAYLQTGYCNYNGENCTLLETTLNNPSIPGGGSSTDISLIDPYYNGCDGAGADCTDADCLTAFRKAEDTFVQVGCEENNLSFVLVVDLPVVLSLVLSEK